MMDEEKVDIPLDYDSFELAKHLGIAITYFHFPESIYGYYTPMLSTQRMIINAHLSIEKQEKACDHLIAHHMLHKGTEFCLDYETFLQLENKSNSRYIILHTQLASLG